MPVQRVSIDYSEALFHTLKGKMETLKKVNHDLAESEHQFRQFIMECPVAIAINSPDGGMDLLNTRFVSTFGYTLDDIPTLDAWWLCAYPDPEYRGHVRTEWQRDVKNALPSGGVVHNSEEYRIPEG